jgi:ABC-2 type transport system ATP-binding protein
MTILVSSFGIAAFLVFKFKKGLINNKVKGIVKYSFLGLLVLALGCSTLYLGNDLDRVSGGLGGNLLNQGLNQFIAIINWFLTTSSVILMFYIFYPKSKALKNFITFFSLLTSIISTIFIKDILIALDINAFDRFNIVILGFVVQNALVLTMSIFVFLKRIFIDKDWKWTKGDIYNFILGLIGLLIVNISFRLPKIVFSETTFLYRENLGFVHRFYIYFAFASIFVVWLLARKRDLPTKRLILSMMSISMLIVFIPFRNIHEMINDPLDKLPLHLCHTAMFLMPLCFIFNFKKLFYFSLYVNVLGVFFAMFIPTEGGDSKFLLDYFRIAFWQNHMGALIMPILGLSFGLFEKPKWKDFLYSTLGFTIYFVLIVIINSLFTAIKQVTTPGFVGTVNFFYVNSDYVAQKLGLWAINLRIPNFIITIGSLKLDFHHYYVLVFYLAFVALLFILYYLYELTFDLTSSLKKSLRYLNKIRQNNYSLKLQKKELHRQMIKVTNFSKKYSSSSEYAVKDINLTIEPGQVFGILGPNGSGKSTLIKSMVGIQAITGGSIEICGYDIEKQPIEAKSNIGFVPDNYALYEKLTGREYVNYFADLQLVPASQRESRINYLLKIFELEKSFDNLIRTYSHGMKQKISIIVALIHKPKVWILDEPLVGLDPSSVYQVKHVMQQYAQEGNIVFFSSHIIDIIEKICDRIVIIKNGELLDDVMVKTLTKKKVNLEQYYMKKIGQQNSQGVKFE